MNASRARKVLAVVLGALALLLAFYGVAAVWGLAVEYEYGMQVLPLAVALPTLFFAFALLVWPDVPGRAGGLATLVLAALLAVAGVAANAVGMHQRDTRAVAASEAFGCNRPGEALQVDPRVDEVYAQLPRPALLYGPVEGSRYGCTAAVSGDAREAFDGWSAAVRDLDGWSVVRDQPRQLVAERGDGITVVVTWTRDDLVTVGVSTPEGVDLGRGSSEKVSGPQGLRG